MKERNAGDAELSRRFHLVLLHLAESARHDLDSTGDRESRAVHSLRTRMKNLRALLPLVRSGIPRDVRKDIAAKAGALKDAFSTCRDRSIIESLWKKLGVPNGNVKRVPRNPRAALSAKLKANHLIQMIDGTMIEEVSWADVLDRYVRNYQSAKKACKKCRINSDPDTFHSFRRKVKDLCYQSQALQPLVGMKRRRKASGKLGDWLGDVNDLQLLLQHDGKHGHPRLAKVIRRKQDALRRTVFMAARKLFEEKPKTIERDLNRCVKFHPAIASQAVRQT